VLLIHSVTADGLKVLAHGVKEDRAYLELISAALADQMAVVLLRQFVCPVAIDLIGLPDETVIREKLKRAIDRRLRDSWSRPAGPGVDLQGGQVSA